MLNNEAGQNYVVLACKLWGIPRPVHSSEGSELSGSGWIVGERGWMLNMKMELMYPYPKVDYSVAKLLALLSC